MNITKEEIGKTFVISWFIISTLYVGYDFWIDYKKKGIEAAYRNGTTDTILKIMSKIREEPCQPLEISLSETSLNLVSSECLR